MKLTSVTLVPGLVVTHLNATMSGGLDILALNEEDVTKMLAATTHLGSENVHFQVCCNYKHYSNLKRIKT